MVQVDNKVVQWGQPTSNSLAEQQSSSKQKANKMLSPGKADPQADNADLYLQRVARADAGGQTKAASAGLVRQALAVAGMSFGCVLDGTVIAYSSPALPSLFKPESAIQINVHWASWIGE